ncbi:MAG: magnesium transporter [Oscillospiraceae bacterium]|nr:magnesium transporter [Oscillospiraceae bacterium]
MNQENNLTLENLDELLNMVREKKYRQLNSIIVQWNEADIAELLEEISDRFGPEMGALVYRMLPKDLAIEVFAFLPADNQGNLVQGMSDKELSGIVEELYVDDAVDMLEELPATVVKRILQNATPETRRTINQFLNYPEDSAGSIMTSEYLAVKKDMNVGQTFDYIRAKGQDMETIYILFVTDAERRLEGIVTIKDLLMHAYEAKLQDIMDTNVIYAVTSDDQEDVADKFNKYDLLTLAVVDQENRMVGIITVDDAVDVMEAEATEDIEKMAAIVPTDKPYLKTGVFETWKSRIPWLLFLMISATFTGQIITSFEDSLAAYVALTSFIPMLMDTGGNSGAQTSATIIRALSLGDVEFRDIFRVIWKEIRVAVVCGITLASINFVKILLFDGMLLHNDGITVPVAAVVCLTMVCTITCAKCVGCILPILAEKLGFDPAVMASPFLTTIVDAISLLIYFQFARVILQI